MTDRLAQPSSKPTPTSRGHPMNNAPRPRVTRFGTSWLGQTLCDQSVERSVGLGRTDREDSPEVPGRAQFLGDSEAVRGVLGEHPQHGVVGDRQTGADHRDRLAGGSPHMPGVGKYSRISIVAPGTMKCGWSSRSDRTESTESASRTEKPPM